MTFMRANLRSLSVPFVVILLTTPAFPFCVCVHGLLKVSEIRGQVVAIYKSRPGFEEPIPNATVTVLKCFAGDCQTVTEVDADNNGRFTVKGVKSGRYELAAKSTNFQKVSVHLKLSNGSGGKNNEIIMALEPTLDCCAGEAKIRKTKLNQTDQAAPNNRLQASALSQARFAPPEPRR